MTSEFNLIAQYFKQATRHTDLSVGDDAALLRVHPNMQLAISADMLVAGTHFFADTDAKQLGWKSLAVNLSDMAAMGATPKWATLAIALPRIDHAWLSDFSEGFFICAKAFDVDLIGGDTTQGPLTISIQIMGEVPKNQALTRSGAQLEDDIWVSGFLGSAALGLAHLQNKWALNEPYLSTCLNALHRPQPQVGLGLVLREMAHSCIDISDGLLADLGHILTASNLGAVLDLAAIPCLSYLAQNLNQAFIQQAILAGGDDYALCFSAPATKRAEILQLGHHFNLPLSRIGHTVAQKTCTVLWQGQEISPPIRGYDHFHAAS